MFKTGRPLAIVTSLLVIFVAGLTPFGCGSGQEEVTAPTTGHTSTGLGSTQTAVVSASNGDFFGGLLGVALKGLISGATGEIGGEVMGLILSELGWGDSQSSADQQALTDMNQKLDQIQSTLNQIEGGIAGIEQQLQITEEEILANTNDPTPAITQIRTYTQELAGMAEGESPGSVTPGDIKDFANQVEAGFLIETAVNSIHDAIIPPTSARVPVLDNFTDLAIKKLGSRSLTDCYSGLEQYFSQLLYYQTQGVNVVVEAKNALAKAQAAQANSQSAKAFLDQYLKHTLAPEVDSFTKNVHRLVLAQVGLTDADSFLSAEAETVLARASFFRIETLAEDHFGLRGTLIATQDLADSPLQLNATDAGGKAYPGTATLYTVTGKAYDFWSQNTVKSASAYTVIEYDFGDVPAGDYSVSLALPQGMQDYKWSSTVKNYDSDYNPTDSGSLVYGNMPMSLRIGATERFDSNGRPPLGPQWQSNQMGPTKNVDVNMEPDSFQSSLTANCPNNTDFSADIGNYASFVFVGDQAATVNLDYSAQVTGGITPSGSQIFYQIAVLDQTSNTSVASKTDVRWGGSSQATFDNPTQVTGTFTFSAQPNHCYSLLVELKILGGTSLLSGGGGRIQVRNVTAGIAFK